ncbi:insulinase family protein, partial [bacterium]|nr:insulinase family protein [bacterium]
MIKNSQFDPTELNREREVILKEIKMYEDSPDETIHELITQNLWRTAALGRPILGSTSTIQAMTQADLMDLYQTQYVSGNILVCLAGNFDWEETLKSLNKHLKDLRGGDFSHKKTNPKNTFETILFQKDIEQVHLALGTPGISHNNPLKHAVILLNAAFGSGMSSRLFQEVREKRGLAYSVFSYHSAFRDAGIFTIYAATSIDHLAKVLDRIHSEIIRVFRKGLTKTELEETKEQVKGNLLIA